MQLLVVHDCNLSMNCDIKNSDVLTERLASRTQVEFKYGGQHGTYCQHSPTITQFTVVQVMSTKKLKINWKSLTNFL